MLYQSVNASEFAPTLPQSSATLTCYCRPRTHTLAGQTGRWGVIICPGGGYELIAETEAEPVALAMLGAGMQSLVLRYSLLPATYPQQLKELACAVAWVRLHAAEMGISRIAVCGFSAGGHLAGCLANRWNSPDLAGLGIATSLLRPDAAIMCYPVISARSFDSPRTLAGVESFRPEFSHVNLDTSVTSENPPTFLWCTCTDQMVPMENTLVYSASLRRACVPFEVHIFHSGPHAMSTATAESAPGPRYADPHVAQWLPLCMDWLRTLPEEVHTP